MAEPLASYRDPAGVEHALVLLPGRHGALLVDRSRAGEWVVAELDAGEGRAQALAVLRDADASTEGLTPKPPIEGYLARAARTGARLCRELAEEDLRGAGGCQREAA